MRQLKKVTKRIPSLIWYQLARSTWKHHCFYMMQLRKTHQSEKVTTILDPVVSLDASYQSILGCKCGQNWVGGTPLWSCDGHSLPTAQGPERASNGFRWLRQTFHCNWQSIV